MLTGDFGGGVEGNQDLLEISRLKSSDHTLTTHTMEFKLVLECQLKQQLFGLVCVTRNKINQVFTSLGWTCHVPSFAILFVER